MSWDRAVLGRTGLDVGRLGIAGGYGAPASAVERAFDHGINYLYWSVPRREGFGRALRNLKPRRDRMVLVIQSYTRVPSLMSWSLESALRKIQYDHADVLLLGLWNSRPWGGILDAAVALRDRGLIRHIAVSSHNRPLIPKLAEDQNIGVLHVRYNAAHTGAETEVFPNLPGDGARPGIVSFTATSWRQLLKPGRIPPGEKVPTAADCYRFVLTNPSVDVCLTGPKDDEQARSAFDAMAAGPMSADEIAWMRRVGAAVHG